MRTLPRLILFLVTAASLAAPIAVRAQAPAGGASVESPAPEPRPRPVEGEPVPQGSRTPIFFEEWPDGTFRTRGGALEVIVGPAGLTFVALEIEETEETRELVRQHGLRPSQRDRKLYRELRERPQKRMPHTIQMRLRGARAGARVQGEERLPGLSHHLLSVDPSKWRRNIPQYARVVVEDVYPGVSMHVRGSETGHVEYDFHVEAGADPGVIEFEAQGNEALRLDDDGDLLLKTRGGQIRHRRPKSYEEGPGRSRQAIPNSFEVRGASRLGFDIPGRTRSRRLIIDPVIVYETVLPDLASGGIAVDPSGAAYIHGMAYDAESKTAAAVVKLDPDGTVVYSTLFGRVAGFVFSENIRVDALGHAFIVDRAVEVEVQQIPIHNPPFDAPGTEFQPYFVAAFLPDGSGLLYSSYTPGVGAKMGPLDAEGRLYLFTQHAPGFTEPMRLYVVARGGSVSQKTLPLPGHTNVPPLLALRPNGGMYATTSGTSPAPPLVNAWQDTMLGQWDIYITHFTRDMEILFATFFGGDETLSDSPDPYTFEDVTAMDTDDEGNLYLFGFFTEPDVPFPLTIPPELGTAPSPYFLAKFSPLGELRWSRTVGEWGEVFEHDFYGEFAVDAQGYSYIPGWLDDFSYPASVVFVFDPDGVFVETIDFGTYNEVASTVAIGEDGDVYVARNASGGYTIVDRLDGDSIQTEVDRSCRDAECPGTGNEGAPVNTMTGNVWLDQTDVAVPGVGSALIVRRSYNSQKALADHASIFGLGWTAPYQQFVRLNTRGRLTLTQGNGVPMDFRETDLSGRFRASVPATETSWFSLEEGQYVRHFREGGREVYDRATGQLAELHSAVGETTRIQRSGSSVTISDSGGRSITLVLNPDGRATSLSGPDGQIATYSYNAIDHLTEVEYVDGTGHRFSYSNDGLLLSISDRVTGDILESHTYDGEGRGITSAVGQGQGFGTRVQERFNFSYSPGQTVVTDQRGGTTTYLWTEIAGTKHVTSRVGPCTSCATPGSETELWSHYPDGRIETYTNGAGETTTYTYYDNGDLETETDALSRTVTYTYTYDPDTGRTLTQTREAPDQGTTTWTYGPAGPLSILERVSPSEERETIFTYNATKVETITDPNKNVTTYTYTPAGDLATVDDPNHNTTLFGYDSMGRRTSVTDPENNTTLTRYDPVGRVREIETPSGTTQFEYDSQGRRTKVIDPRKRETRYSYDRYGRLKSVTDPELGTTRYDYDSLSNLTSLTDAKGRMTQFTYDAFNRVEHTVYPDGKDEHFTYDGAGRLDTKTDRNDVVTTYFYDLVGRLDYKTYDDGTAMVDFDYDDADRMTDASNGVDGDTLSWVYDLAGQVTEENSTFNGTKVSYTYWPDGSRETMSLDGSLFLTYGYDVAGRLTTITRGADVFEFHYDFASRRDWMDYPNGVRTSYHYDDSSRLLHVGAEPKLGGTPITSFDYGYDDAGNRTSKTTLDYVETYGYDDLYRLTQVTRTGAGANSWEYGYDAVGNRTTYQVGADIVTPAYNDRNQLTSTVVGGQLVVRGTLDEPGSVLVNGQPARMLQGNVFEATFDVSPGANPNQFTVLAVDDTGNATPLQNYETTVTGTEVNYQYDNNGNLIEKVENGATWTYEWNAENQLTRVCKDVAPCDSDAIAIASFKYDPQGRRVEKMAGGVTTRWTYDGADILRETAGVTVSIFVHGPDIDQPLRKETSETDSYYHADGLGSIVATTDGAGIVVQDYRYGAWGTVEAGQSMPGYAFTGREWDPETGLYYYRARYYDPEFGRFVSADPLGFRAGVNFYAYVANRPTLLADPHGLDWVYSQSTGHLYVADPSSPSGYTYVAKGYAGHGNGMNSPDWESVVGVRPASSGPPPRGAWDIGSPLFPPQTSTGNYSLPMNPRPGTNTHGRTLFRIHGSRRPWGTASEGCPIFQRPIRERIWQSGDHVLQVLPSDPRPPQRAPLVGAPPILLAILSWMGL